MTLNLDKCYVGIDVSKDILDIHILPSGKYMQFNNDKLGLPKLAKKLAKLNSPSIVIEATGGYERSLARALQQAGLEVSVVNPRPIRDFAKALGKLAKTDRIDAKVIASYAEKIQPPPNMVRNEAQEQVLELNTRRNQLIKMLIMEKNRLDKVSKEMASSINRMIKAFEEELAVIEKKLHQTIRHDDEFQRKNALLQSIKGVGPVVAGALIAGLPELGTLGPKQISALVGVVPYNRDSGKTSKQRIIWGGRAEIRTTLYMSVLVAIRHNAQIKAFYEHLCAKGKKKKSAMIACIHKMLIIMNAMVKNDKPWQFAAALEN